MSDATQNSFQPSTSRPQNIMAASYQWATRPPDERYLTVDALRDAVHARRQRSFDSSVAVEHLQPFAHEGTDDNALGLRAYLGSGEVLDTQPTNWAFSQLCQRAGAPAAYLRKLPAMIAQIPLAWSLEVQRGEDAKLLVERIGSNGSTANGLRAVTSTSYGRIWDSEVVDAIVNNIDLGRWKVPSASYAAKDPKRATTLYASDRDVFVFLVDESTPIEVPRTNGRDTLFRGFFVSNSEVGKAVLEVTAFLYRYVCDNRIIWGAEHLRQLRIKHTAGAPARFIRDAQPALAAMVAESTEQTVAVIRAASQHEVGKTHKDAAQWLQRRGFTAALSRAAVERAEAEEGNPRTIWNLVQGITSIARDGAHTDSRVELETKAGALLKAAA